MLLVVAAEGLWCAAVGVESSVVMMCSGSCSIVCGTRMAMWGLGFGSGPADAFCWLTRGGGWGACGAAAGLLTPPDARPWLLLLLPLLLVLAAAAAA